MMTIFMFSRSIARTAFKSKPKESAFKSKRK